jgi:hypothetical protein
LGRLLYQFDGDESVFARYNIVNEADLFDAAPRYEGDPHPGHATQTA